MRTTMRLTKYFMYAVIGSVLYLAGISAIKDWQFWVIIVSVVAIDNLSGLMNQYRRG